MPQDPTKYGIKGVRALPARYNAKLRALVFTEEYLKSLEVLEKLREKGELDAFLEKAVTWWRDVNIFEMKKQEMGRAGSAMQVLRDAWPRIWPDSMDRERLQAFSAFSALYRRLDSSRLIDLIFDEAVPVLANNNPSLSGSLSEQATVESMSDEARTKRMRQKLENTYILRQYADWVEKDDNIGVIPRALAPQMVPFFAEVFSELEWKAATQAPGEELPVEITATVFGVILLAGVAYFQLVGVRELDISPPTSQDAGGPAFPSFFQAAPDIAYSKRSTEDPRAWWKLSKKEQEEFIKSAPPLKPKTLSEEKDAEKKRATTEKVGEILEALPPLL